MPRFLSRWLLSGALILAVVALSRRGDAKPPLMPDATPRELAAPSRPTAKAAPPARPHGKVRAAPKPSAKGHAKPNAHVTAKPHATARTHAKPKPDRKVKATAAGSKAKRVPLRPSPSHVKPAPKASLGHA